MKILFRRSFHRVERNCHGLETVISTTTENNGLQNGLINLIG